ncbi:hypothetical protein TNCV_581 [Trichonephila clavipes]|nr:hypothetical protein TNCV_581 [Trichonephila clavipes]
MFILWSRDPLKVALAEIHLIIGLRGDPSNLGAIDGQSIWEALVTNSRSPRTLILHNIDPINNVSSLRKGDLKLMTGNLTTGLESWSGQAVLEDMEKPQSMDEWVFKDGSTVRDILRKEGMYLPKKADTWRKGSEVKCDGVPETANQCIPLDAPCLYNIATDPCEMNNIANRHPEVRRSI